MKGQGIRAAGYVRVSDESQVEGHSLDAQRREITRYCERNGYSLFRFYADEGLSAHTDRIDKRPQLVALLEDAGRRLFDVVIVHTIDRWARKVRVQTQALAKLGDAKVGFLSVAENIDFATPHGRFLLTSLGAASELSSDLLGVHVSKSQTSRAELGLPVGPVPFGFLPSARTASRVEPREAAVVSGSFERKIAGWTNGQIANWLNSQGFRTRTGRLFTEHAVKDMLNTRFYVGIIPYHGSEFPGKHEAIVSEATYQRAQLRRQQPRQPRCQVAGPKAVLHGRLYCGHCGNSVQSDRDRHNQPRYRERHGWPCETNGRTLSAKFVDVQIGKILIGLDLDPTWRQRMTDLTMAHHDGPSPEQLKADRRRLSRAYADGGFSDYEYAARLSEIDLTMNAARQVELPTLDEAAQIFDNLDELWSEATPEEQSMLIAPLIERVYLDIQTKRVGAITPAPAFKALLSGALRQSNRSDVVLLDGADVWQGGDGFSPVSTNTTHDSDSFWSGSFVSSCESSSIHTRLRSGGEGGKQRDTVDRGSIPSRRVASYRASFIDSTTLRRQDRPAASSRKER